MKPLSAGHVKGKKLCCSYTVADVLPTVRAHPVSRRVLHSSCYRPLACRTVFVFVSRPYRSTPFCTTMAHRALPYRIARQGTFSAPHKIPYHTSYSISTPQVACEKHRKHWWKHRGG